MEKIGCPICESAIEMAPVDVKRIPWADCACSDSGLCLYHRYSVERPPPRPDNEALEKKVAVAREDAIRDYYRKLERSGRYNRMLQERDRMRELLAAIVKDEVANYGYRDFAKRLLEDISQ